METKIALHDVIVRQNSVVTSVGCVVSGAMVERDTSRESETGLKAILLNQFPGSIFKLFTVERHQNMIAKSRHMRNSKTGLHKVINTMVIRPLDDPTRCAQSVVADLQPLGLGYMGVGDGLSWQPAHWFLLAPRSISNRLAAISKGGLFDPQVEGRG